MTAPRKLYGVSLKPRPKTPARELVEIPAPEVRPDLLEAVRRSVVEHREMAERTPPR
jgi:hypothetical protein